MATTKRRIEYELGISVDNAGIDLLKQQLVELRLGIKKIQGTNQLTDSLIEAYDAANALSDILDKSYNTKLGQLDLSKVRSEIISTFDSVKKLQSQLEKGGAGGVLAFNSLAKSVLNTNVYIKQSNALMNEMATSFKNTVKWGISSSVFNSLTGSLQKAWDYSVKLDKSLNDIRIVADKSADEMERFAKSANTAAKNLGASTKEYTQAALIYYQQGDTDEVAQAKADVTLKTANVTGQSGQEVSEQLTAVWNGYKVSAAEAELYVDKLAAVAASTASDLEELATGMSKVASAANMMGVDVDQLNATLATVVSVTRQAPESVGTAFKTIYARMGDIEAGLDAETTLGSYTEQMKEIAGINVLDANKQLRDMGEVIEEVGSIWGKLSREQQVALSQVMAGTRQYNNLLALFDNWEMYTEALNTSKQSAGELQKQQDIYMESTEAHLQKLATEAEKTYDILFDADSVNSMTDAVTGLMSLLNGYLNSLGGGLRTIAGLGLTLGNIFGSQIGESLAKTTKGIQEQAQNKDAEKLKAEIIKTYEDRNQKISDSTLQYEIESTQKLFDIQKMMSEQEQKDYIDRQREIAQLEERIVAATEYKKIAEELRDQGLMSFTGEVGETDFETATDNISNKIEDLESERRYFTGEYDNVTKKDFEDRQSEFENNWKDSHNGSARGMKNTKIWKENAKWIEALEKHEKEGNKQLSIFSEKRNDLLWQYKEELELKMQSVEVTEKDAEILESVRTALEKQVISETDRANILEYQQKKIDEQQVILNQVAKGAQGLADAEKNTTPALIQNVDQMKRYQQATYEAKIEQEKLTTSIKGLTAIGSIVTTVTGTISMLGDKSASTEDKIKTLLMGIASAGVMILSNWQSISKIGPGLIIMMNSATVALGGTTAGVTTLSGAFTTLGATIWASLAPILPVILFVAAAIAVVTAAVIEGIKAYNADADAAKEAAEAAEHARDAAIEAKTAYDNLVSGLDKYEEGVKALEELTEGTEEYKEALDAANQSVIDLIKADASLAKYAKKRGELYVFEDEEGNDITDKLRSDAKSKMNSAEATANMAQIYANQTSLKSQRTNLLRQADLHRGDKAAAGAFLGGTLGFVVSGGQAYGAAAGAAAGAGLGAVNSLTDKQLEEVLQTITDNYGTLTRENLEKLSFLNDAEINALMDNKTSLESLAKSTDELNATNKLLIEQGMANALENNDIIKNAKTINDEGKEVGLSDKQKNAISSLYSEGYTDEQAKKARKKLEDEWYQDAAFGGGNEDAVHDEYAKIMGYTLVDDKWGDKAVFTDKDGKEVTVSDDAMRAHIVNTKLAEQIDDYDTANLQKLTDAVSSVDTREFDKKYGFNLDDAFFDAVASGGKFDLSNMFADITPSELEEISNLSGEDWKNALGLTDEELKTLGFNSAEDLAKSIEDGLTSWEWSPEAALDSLLKKNQNAENLEEKGLDTKEFKDYATYLMNTADEADNLADSLAEDADAAMVVTRGIMRMNNGVEKLSENFEGWSDVLKKSDKASEEYHEALTGMQDAMADLLDTEDKYITDNFVQEHMEDIEKAAKGDADAIDRLHKELAKEMVLNIATDNEIAKEEIDQFINTINTLDIPDLEAGVVLNGTDEFAQELMKIVQNSKMTAEQAKEFFGQMGFDAEFSTTPVETVNNVPITKTESEITSIFPLKMTSKTYQDGFQAIKQTVDVPSLSTTDGETPEIKLTKRAGGSFNNSSSINKGSGGKKGSSSKPKNEDLLKDVIDRYHDVNIELEEIGNSLSKVQKETEQLVGQDLINNLADQYALLNKQIDTTAEKLNIAKGEMSELRDKLAAKGMTFSADGSISNYAATYQAQMDYVNGLINQYNNMSATQQEAFQPTLDKAKEEFEKFKEDLARYDELLTGEIPALEENVMDAINEQIALKLDAFHHEIQLRLDMSEAERDWNSFYNKVIKDIDDEDILGNAEAKLEDFMSYYKEEMDGIIQVNTQHINDILTDLKTMDEGGIAKYYGKDGVNDRARALEDLKTYYEQLMADLEAIHDLSDEIHESYVDMIDEAQEKFDEQISTFETINNLLEHDKNVISMIYGEESYSALAQFYEKQEDNYNKQLDFQKQQIVFWQAQMAAAEEGSDAWNAAKDNWLSAVDAWNSAIETAIENLQDKYLNAINAIFQNLNNNITGGMGLDYVESEWDLINQNADQYLDTVNAIYQVQELQNKYLDAIDKTDSPAQQKKLNDLMKQETDYLREQDKLSEYDLERANLKYELALKQMALEEAQQNKTQLRLRRDSQGNYTYQYTADEDQVASIQSEIADLYNQLYNLDAEQYRGNLEEIYNIWNEFQERMAEAAQINDPEQRAAKELLIKQQYSDLINGLVEKNENLQANLYQSTMSHLFDLYNQNTANYADMSEDQKAILDMFINAETDLTGAAFDNMFDLYNVNIEQFKNMTDEQQNILMSSMIPQWNSGVQQMTDRIAGEGGFIPTCKDAFEELDQATQDYMTGLEELQKNADVSFEDVKDGIDNVIAETEKLLKDNDELITQYETELEAIQSVIDELDDLIKKYEDAEKAAKKATEEAYKYWQETQRGNADVDPNLDKPEEDKPQPVNEPAPTNNKPAEAPKPSLNTGSYVDVKAGTRWYADSYGGGNSGIARGGKIAYINSRGSHPYNIGGLGWIKKSDIVGYDTGGYTGDWANNNGRLAMLHQKELVLNANDTTNMLNAITILRDITANLGATLLNKMAAISAGNASSIGQGLAAAGMEQNVVINAEFPNATNSREIEDALNNLVNRASQHIQKNR